LDTSVATAPATTELDVVSNFLLDSTRVLTESDKNKQLKRFAAQLQQAHHSVMGVDAVIKTLTEIALMFETSEFDFSVDTELPGNLVAAARKQMSDAFALTSVCSVRAFVCCVL